MSYIFMSIVAMLGVIVFITHSSLKRLNSSEDMIEQK